jgi:hypothetical protein
LDFLVIDDERHDFYLFAAWQSFLMEWLLMHERSNFRTAELRFGHLEGIRLLVLAFPGSGIAHFREDCTPSFSPKLIIPLSERLRLFLDARFWARI